MTAVGTSLPPARERRISVWRVPLIGFGLAVSACAFALYIDRRIESVVQAQLTAVLRMTVNTAEAGVSPVLALAARAASSAASDPQLMAAAQVELGCSQSDRPCSAGFGEALRPYLAQGGFAGAALGLPGGAVRPSALGPAGALAAPLSAAAVQLAGAALAVTAARVADRPLLFMAVRAPPGVLLFGLPMAAWTRPLTAARFGQRGEAFAFDRSGRLLSDLRFEQPLRRAGLLPATGGSALLLELRDPGGDLTAGEPPKRAQPLTRLVLAAQRAESGLEIQPYRGYRGVPVVGAFRTLPAYGISVAFEIDAAGAYQTLDTLQMTLKWLVVALTLSAFALLAATVVSLRLRSRAEKAERMMAHFGQYRLVRKIGEGAMGAVYLASHEMLRRPAAIKVLRPEKASPEAIARFEREVRVTATLKHPNTVAVYDYGRTERGDLFYVMEFLDGLDLQNMVLRFGAMPGARVVHFLRQLCGSLSEAHAELLVHRDIKPANLLACRVGGVPDTLKVVDFGVAKSLTGEALGLTVDRVLLGTPEYMAPELFDSSDRASPQSDLYSVGAVAYFLLTGKPVFEAGSMHELCMAQLTRKPEPPSSRLGASVDPALEGVIMACLAKRRELRPASARALQAMLERSPLANVWTPSAAEGWWQAHASELEEVRASRAPAQPSPEFPGLRPARA